MAHIKARLTEHLATRQILVLDHFSGRLLTMYVRNSIQSPLSAIVLLVAASTAVAQEWKSGVEWQEPPLVTPGAANDAAPSDAIVLFDGTNLNQWDRW